MTKEQSYTRFWEGSKRMWITFLFQFYYDWLCAGCQYGVCPDNSYCKCAGRHFK